MPCRMNSRPKDKDPTDAQVKEFWEGCGFRLKKQGHKEDPMYVLSEPDGEQYNIWYRGRYYTNELPIKKVYPPIDLNNLFKYAVPKLSVMKLTKSDHHLDYLAVAVDYNSNKEAKRANPDPALALFWALYPIITGKERE